MIFPFKKGVIGYDYGVKTTYSDHHLGVDWNTNFEDLPCPIKSKVISISTGPDAGKAIVFQPIGKKEVIRWVHLNKYYVKVGDIVEEGAKFVQSGNSGAITTGAHTHEDIWRNGKVTLKFKDTINPHKYYMSVEFVHLSGTSEYGFLESTSFVKVYYRGTNEADIKFQASKFGLNITDNSGNINFALAKEISL